MCLTINTDIHTNERIPCIASADILVYKLFYQTKDKKLLSFQQKMEYEYNKLYSTRFSYSTATYIVHDAVVINEGFHSFETYEYLKAKNIH